MITKLMLNWSGYRPYTWDNVHAYAPLEAGVYKISVRLKNDNFRPVYVGQAADLDKRLKEHLADSEPNDCLRGHITAHECHFQFAALSRQADRDGAERSLYYHYRPECNSEDNIPSWPDVEVNPN